MFLSMWTERASHSQRIAAARLCLQDPRMASVSIPLVRNARKARVVARLLIRSNPSIATACRMLVISPRTLISGEFARLSTSAAKTASVRSASCTRINGTSSFAVSRISFVRTGRNGGKS